MNEESDPIKDMIEESGLDAAEYADVAEALSALRGLVPEQAPAASVELVSLLSGGVVTPLALVRSHRRRVAVASGAIVVTVVLGTGVAAASNSLPEPAQRFLSELSEKYLPFEFPSPDEHGEESSPSEPGEGAQTTKTDNGGHVGGGTGAGRTDNPGKHAGANAGKDNPEKAEQAEKGADNGRRPDSVSGNGKSEKVQPTDSAGSSDSTPPKEIVVPSEDLTPGSSIGNGSGLGYGKAKKNSDG